MNIYLKTRDVNAIILKLLRNVNFKTRIYKSVIQYRNLKGGKVNFPIMIDCEIPGFHSSAAINY